MLSDNVIEFDFYVKLLCNIIIIILEECFMRKYEILAIVVDIIHLLVIAFWICGFLIPKEWVALKTFHSAFGSAVVISQLLMGINCPLQVLSNYLRKKADPDYEIVWESFTLKLMRKIFGISLNQSIIFTCVVILAVIGLAQLIAMYC